MLTTNFCFDFIHFFKVFNILLISELTRYSVTRYKIALKTI